MAEQWPFKPLVESSSLSSLTVKAFHFLEGFFYFSQSVYKPLIESSPFGDRRVFSLIVEAFHF